MNDDRNIGSCMDLIRVLTESFTMSSISDQLNDMLKTSLDNAVVDDRHWKLYGKSQSITDPVSKHFSNPFTIAKLS
jgi:hypothetical protein